MAFEASRRTLRNAIAGSALVLLGGCGGSAIQQFPLREPMWEDPDRRPFRERPEKYFSPFGWDAADQTLFRPISRFFALDPAGEAVNVNALDEVPDSSWFTNRLGRRRLSTAELAAGPCVTPPIDPKGPWLVTGAKPDGANPGFLIEDTAKRKYLLKFDGTYEGERATSADVVGSRLYHAAGYFVPCNRITFFDRSILKIDQDATAEEGGDEVKLTMKHVETVLSKAVRIADGRYRANASLFVEGKPLGPWTYQGTRDDDPNDVVAHEDRRDLRGMEVLAAWTNHFDSREQNTMAAWMEVPGGGYVRHYLIDFGDCFGSVWEPPMLGRRLGHAYYLDIPHVAEDFVTLGLIRRPWDKARFGPSGTVFGYYNVELFAPDKWRPGYPNPAFGRKRERDAAWMARIISEFRDEDLRAIVETARLSNPVRAEEFARILIGRRDKILKRYLSRLSPLARPELESTGPRARLCLRDLAVSSGVSSAASRGYSGRAWLGEELAPAAVSPRAAAGGRVCTELPASNASPRAPRYLIVDQVARSRGEIPTKPARVHLYHLGGGDYRVVGLERPGNDDPPS